MRRLVKQFTAQLSEALEIGGKANLNPSKNPIYNIVITGLGGSGIGGKIATQIVADQLKIPTTINNDYTLPKFVNENTLVIVSSFSGNTEETLEALKVAQEANAEIACITNGGKLAEIAKENNYNLLILPKAFSPRAMLTYSVIQQLFLFNHYGFINNDYVKRPRQTVTLLNNEVEDIISTAKKTAIALQNKTICYLSESSWREL